MPHPLDPLRRVYRIMSPRCVASPVPKRAARKSGNRKTRHRSGPGKPLNSGKANSINMTELRVSGHVRRVGNSLALLIPLPDARKAGISAGDPVDAVIHSGVPDALGLLADFPYRPFERAKEGLWRDRI